MDRPLRAHIVTLGCPKNLVDSEAAAGVLRRAGCRVVEDPEVAELLMVNACSFLDSSWRETVEEVERLARFKKAGRRLILMGCLPRHRDEDLEAILPQVDHFLPTGAHALLPQLLASWRNGGARPSRMVEAADADRFAGFEDRDTFTPPHTAYVKVAEGCNRTCSFCAIPAIRGRQTCRPVSSVVREIETMVGRGVREVTLLSQDIFSYRDGTDGFLGLIAAAASTGVDWLRIFYIHPAGVTIDHIEKLFSHSSVVRYLEMPVQHASSRVLGRMRRGHDSAHAFGLLNAIRRTFPDTVIRSEVIAGFPGETETEFDELKDFIREFEFDSLGVFPYSPEPGTRAVDLDFALDPDVIQMRAEELGEVQAAVSFGIQSRRIGKEFDVLIDRALDGGETGFDGCTHAGRFYGQALEIDGEVHVDAPEARPGDFVRAKIVDADAYDLRGVVVGRPID